MLDFRPPKDSPLVIGLCDLLLPYIMSVRCGGAELKVVGDGLERFHKLKGKRAVICPNHSHRHDPEIMHAFSAKVGEHFNFIAAREVFDWNDGINGWFLQRMGVYSVVRGAVDRESFKTTKRILVEGKKKLVLFPEGEISRQNDLLLPLEAGAAQLAFMALDELHKTKPDESIYIVPVSLKYTYKQDLKGKIAALLTKIEDRIGLDGSKEESLYKRFRNAAEVVLKTLEDEYNSKPSAGSSLNERMDLVKDRALEAMAEVLNINLPKARHLDQVRVLRNAMDDFIYGDHDDLPSYQRKIYEEKAEKIRHFYRDLDRVVSFIAIYDGYLTPPVSQERMLSVLELLETEIFGESKVKGPRLVLIGIGEPIDLLEYYSAYKSSKKQVIEQISADLTKQLYGMLMEIEKHREPVYVS